MFKQMNIFFILITAIMPIFTPFFLYPKLLDYITLPKWIFTTLSCIYILLAFFISLKSKVIRNIIINRKITLIEMIAFLYLILIIISTVLSVNVNRSIIGSPWRFEGLISLVNYIIIFLVVTNFYKYKRSHIILLGISAAIISIHSILYYFNINIIPPYIAILVGRASAWSLMGNRNFLGSYLSLTLPLFVYIYIKYDSTPAFILNGLLFTSLISSLTRSAYVAFAFYIVFFIIYFYTKKQYNKRLIILLSSFVLIFALINTITKNDISLRMLSIKHDTVSINNNEDSNSNSVSQRVFIWKNAVTLVPKYILHGSGPDTFDIPFMGNFQKETERVLKSNDIVDKAHNEYLQIAVTLGIPALITYLALISLLLFKSIKTSKSTSFLIPLNISFIAYLIQAFFNISVVSVAPLYWALLGVICSYIKNNAYLPEDSLE